MFQRAGMREGGEPLPLAFQYLILMIWRPCDLNLVMISSVSPKCQDFKCGMPFYEMRLKTSKFKAGRGVSEKVLAVGFCLGSGLFGSCNSN